MRISRDKKQVGYTVFISPLLISIWGGMVFQVPFLPMPLLKQGRSCAAAWYHTPLARAGCVFFEGRGFGRVFPGGYLHSGGTAVACVIRSSSGQRLFIWWFFSKMRCGNFLCRFGWDVVERCPRRILRHPRGGVFIVYLCGVNSSAVLIPSAWYSPLQCGFYNRYIF